MAVIYRTCAQSYWEPLKPREDEACFLCGKPLVTDDVVVQEGCAGLINGVGQYAKRPHVLYLHSDCADQLGNKLKLDARAIRYYHSGSPTPPH